MRFLEVAGADFGRRNVRGDGQHRHTRAVTIKQTIDQVQIARPTAAGTHGELSGQMRFGTRGESRDLLVPDMDPLDLALPADRIGNPVEAVADDAINPLDANSGQGFGELISNGLCHWYHSLRAQCRRAGLPNL